MLGSRGRPAKLGGWGPGVPAAGDEVPLRKGIRESSCLQLWLRRTPKAGRREQNERRAELLSKTTSQVCIYMCVCVYTHNGIESVYKYTYTRKMHMHTPIPTQKYMLYINADIICSLISLFIWLPRMGANDAWRLDSSNTTDAWSPRWQKRRENP